MRVILYIAIPLAILTAFFAIKASGKTHKEDMREIKPVIGNIETSITSTATVKPQSRLEIKPPINGRIDEILVKEGQKIKAGDILARMSSTERAALLDAARARGPDDLKYWEDVFKPTPLLSPIDGEVIVSTTESGQTVTSSDVVVVLSDKLIVQAQVDETDVGKVRIGQKAQMSLDAYPNIKVEGVVDHIYYESQIVNNVTIYQVDIIPATVPEVFRSGMSATVNIVEEAKTNVLTIPLDAVKRGKDGEYVLISGSGKKPLERKVGLGISDDNNVEVLSGLTENDRVFIVSQKYDPSSGPKKNTNPLMPAMRRGGR
ncbi:MAG: efflux RND transporter periplasmic adaptor subunit [Candidatus Omnitrophica bacterium]|nr:efflux RND transporter periplasmic adaptor subunit [Candidatus Omnitrophota bacterium]